MGKKNKEERRKKLVIIQEGGIGLAIVSTAAITKLREKNPDAEITVVSPYTEVFYNNPRVDFIYAPVPPSYIYERHAREADEIFILRPDKLYTRSLYRRKNEHMIKVMLAEMVLPWEHEKDLKPEMVFYEHEQTEAQMFLQQFNKPTILIQQTGSTAPLGAMRPSSMINDKSWDIMQANKLVAGFKHMFNFVQIRLPYEPIIMDAYQFQGPVTTRRIAALLPYVFTFVAIDSFLQHASAIFHKRGIVLWGPTHPANLGYDHNVNISHPESCPAKAIHCRRPETHLFDFLPGSGQTMNQPLEPWRCPTRACMKSITADGVAEKIMQLANAKQEKKENRKEESNCKTNHKENTTSEPGVRQPPSPSGVGLG